VETSIELGEVPIIPFKRHWMADADQVYKPSDDTHQLIEGIRADLVATTTLTVA
jgi:hypothetical protein